MATNEYVRPTSLRALLVWKGMRAVGAMVQRGVMRLRGREVAADPVMGSAEEAPSAGVGEAAGGRLS